MKTHCNINIFKSCIIGIFAAASVFIVSCQGPEGPMGPSGQMGPQGYDGNDGANGKNGQNGTAFVGTAIYDVAPKDWTGNIDGYKTTLTVPELNEAIFTQGALLIYELMDEGTDHKSFHLLPYTEAYGNQLTYLDFDAYIGKITIKLRWTDNGVNTTNAPTSNYAFKVVLIDGVKMIALKQEVNITDASAVMAYAKSMNMKIISK